MRRSLGGANGGMLRTTVQRAAGGTSVATESFSHTPTSPCSKPTKTSSSSCKSTNSNTLLITTNAPSSPFSRNQTSVPVSWTFSSSSSSVSDEFDDQWECIDHGVFQESEDYGEDHFVFGSVPSVDEVHHAVSSLQQVLEPVSYSQLTKDRAAYDSDKDVANHMYSPTNLIRKIPSVGSEVNWMEPSLQPWNSRFLKPQGSDRVCNALHLLQTEPAIQRMVVALSSDKAVWDAVMNNDVVRELRDSIVKVDKNVGESAGLDKGSDDPESAVGLLSCIFNNTKAKIMDVIDMITGVINKLFLPPESEETGKATDLFEDKLRTSLLLSVVVLLIVVVTRASRA
ncbi:hypothetical protein POM88_042253 [Heracleum sosnowskyi]|uniref:Uncharacterized protein n=1 Tax=Heracleum sosnowskyi TaxID=360622 RepID=A0AAD8MBG6_9APIA|nr:hypothetical protein POM88_042253 [Heracleum sosnowskyi]